MKRPGLLMMLGLMVGVVGFIKCGDNDENPTSSSDSDYGCDVTSNRDGCTGCGYDELKAANPSSLSSDCKSMLRYLEVLIEG